MAIPQSLKNKKHTIEIVVDRVSIREGLESRLSDSIETALKQSSGIVQIYMLDGKEITFSQNYACTDCGINIEELSPHVFIQQPIWSLPRVLRAWQVYVISEDMIFPTGINP